MKITLIRDKNFYRKILSIMLPVALQQAINIGVNMMDTVMLGSFGEIQLSASSLANQYYNCFTILCMGIIGGSSILASQFWGAGDKEHVRETFNSSAALSGRFRCICNHHFFLCPTDHADLLIGSGCY